MPIQVTSTFEQTKFPNVPGEQDQTMLGMGKFEEGDSDLSSSVIGFLEKDFNIKIPPGAATPFSITYAGAKFNFVSLPPVENTNIDISWNEKLFLNVNGTLADLDRQEVTIGNVNLVMWSYLNTNNNEMEPVLWYKVITEEEWQEMSFDERNDFYAAFAPPTPLEGEVSGFSRASNQSIGVKFSSLPDHALKVQASLKPIYAAEMEADQESRVREVMPPLWYLDVDETWKQWEQNDIRIMYGDNRQLTLVAFNKDGEKIAWADYKSINVENTVWYSILARYSDGLIPIILSARMGEFKQTRGKLYVDPILFRLRDKDEIWTTPDQDQPYLSQKMLQGWEDMLKEKNWDGLASWGLSSGQDIMDAYTCTIASYLSERNGITISAEEIRDKLKAGEPVLVDFEKDTRTGGTWDVSKGIEIVWEESLIGYYFKPTIQDDVFRMGVSSMNRATTDGGTLDSSLIDGLMWNLFDNDSADFYNKMNWLYSILEYPDAANNQVRSPFWVEKLPQLF